MAVRLAFPSTTRRVARGIPSWWFIFSSKFSSKRTVICACNGFLQSTLGTLTSDGVTPEPHSVPTCPKANPCADIERHGGSERRTNFCLVRLSSSIKTPLCFGIGATTSNSMPPARTEPWIGSLCYDIYSMPATPASYAINAPV